jgi:hypothetical protein
MCHLIHPRPIARAMRPNMGIATGTDNADREKPHYFNYFSMIADS